MNPKFKVVLVLKLIVIGIVYLYVSYVLCFLGLFLYFGSGASASSETAEIVGNSAMIFVVLPPLGYNLYKGIKYRKQSEFLLSNTHFLATVLLIVFCYLIGKGQHIF